MRDEDRSSEFLETEIARIKDLIMNFLVEKPTRLSQEETLTLARYLDLRWQIDCAILESREAETRLGKLVKSQENTEKEPDNHTNQTVISEQPQSYFYRDQFITYLVIYAREQEIQKLQAAINTRGDMYNRLMDFADFRLDDPLRLKIEKPVATWLEAELDELNAQALIWSRKLMAVSTLPGTEASKPDFYSYLKNISDEAEHAKRFHEINVEINERLALLWSMSSFFSLPETESEFRTIFISQLEAPSELQSQPLNGQGNNAEKNHPDLFDAALEKLLRSRHAAKEDISRIREHIDRHGHLILQAMNRWAVPKASILRRHLSSVLVDRNVDEQPETAPVQNSLNKRKERDADFRAFVIAHWEKIHPNARSRIRSDDLTKLGGELDARGFLLRTHLPNDIVKQINTYSRKHQNNPIRSFVQFMAYINGKEKIDGTLPPRRRLLRFLSGICTNVKRRRK